MESSVQSNGGGSIRERMAMLQLNQVGRNVPAPPARAGSQNAPVPPPLPPGKAPPPLPARKTSRSSLGSSYSSSSSSGSDGSSIASLGTNSSGRSLPPVYTGKDPLPIKFEQKPKAQELSKRVPSVLLARSKAAPVPPPRAPPLPSRANTTPAKSHGPPQLPSRRLPPPVSVPPLPQRSKLPVASHTDSAISNAQPPIPRSTRPPPVPLSTRPTLSTRPSTAMPCLICYDFSGPDHWVSLPQFDRTRVDSLQQLAVDLTTPFSSTLDKARALFAWLHHNVAYDVHGFLNGEIPPQKPGDVLRNGTAVCAGYAELFCTLASHAGLEAKVISGHGKGYGFTEGGVYEGNHAWSAVKMDWGWHLIDCCWGAGSITGPPSPGYNKHLSSQHFTNPPSVFGRSHFPEDSNWQCREDGRIIDWDEYMTPDQKGHEPMRYAPFGQEFGFSEKAVYPPVNNIDTFAGRRTVFSIGLPCEHMSRKEEWVMFLAVGEFGDKNWTLVNSDGRGRYHAEIDLPNSQGLTVGLYHVVTWKGNDARGLSAREWQSGVGNVGWGWSPIVIWGADK